jgi:hypothetical protein
MAAEQVDQFDALCTGLLRGGRRRSEQADVLFYSQVIMSGLDDLVPAVEAACANWPRHYLPRRQAEEIIVQTRRAARTVRQLITEVETARRSRQSLDSTGRTCSRSRKAEQQCEVLARAAQTLKRLLTTLNRSAAYRPTTGRTGVSPARLPGPDVGPLHPP